MKLIISFTLIALDLIIFTFTFYRISTLNKFSGQIITAEYTSAILNRIYLFELRLRTLSLFLSLVRIKMGLLNCLILFLSIVFMVKSIKNVINKRYRVMSIDIGNEKIYKDAMKTSFWNGLILLMRILSILNK